MTSLRLLILTLAACLPLTAQASESAAVTSARATVTLLSDTDAVTPGTPYQLGLRFDMAPGWHIYGRNPGDAGLPPELNWTLPEGTKTGDILWPTPTRQAEGPLMTFAYTGTTLLVVPASGPGPVRLHASWLICKNICVPEEGDFRLDLPAGPAAASPQAAQFTATEAQRPRPSPFQARIAPNGTLAVSGDGLAAVRDAWFMPDLPDLVTPTGPQTLSHTADGITLTLPTGASFKPGDTLSGTLVLRDGTGPDTALSIAAIPGAVAAPDPIWRVFAAALLGGLILNLMPCVFPVLAMKAMAIARLSTESRSAARTHAAGYTIGVVLSFTAIGGVILALRGLGHVIGWGFQFQSTAFVAAMAWVLFGVGLNLSGVFDVPARFAGAGQSLTLRQDAIGSFCSGVLAVLVATPCTAPFMSLALAAALTAPPAETVSLFAALGVGLALPAALLAIMPGTARLLPRPGPWMEILRQALAFPMYAACAWLVWVVSLQAGGDGVLAVAAGLVAVGFAAWVLRFARIGPAFAIVACLAALALLPGIAGTASPTQTVAGQTVAGQTAAGEAFTTARLASLRADGKPVFVNLTAAWCVTCLVNEKLALEPSRAAFDRRGVTVLTGDWTRADPQITAFLQAQGRDGVPLYLYFPPGGLPAVVLPQVLTPSIVLGVIAG